MSAFEKRVDFNSDDVVIVYDDMKYPFPWDLCFDPDRPISTRASGDESRVFKDMVNEFLRVILGTPFAETYRHPSGMERRPVRFVRFYTWLEYYKDIKHTTSNTPVFLKFVFFMFSMPARGIFASCKIFELMAEEMRKCNHLHAVVPIGSRYSETVSFQPILLVHKPHAGRSDFEIKAYQFLKAMARKVEWVPERQQGILPVEWPVFQERESAREYARNSVVHTFLAMAVLSDVKSPEATALSAVVVEGLANPSDSAWGHFLAGDRRLYDPRILRYIWHFVTGDTKPKPNPELDKRKQSED